MSPSKPVQDLGNASNQPWYSASLALTVAVLSILFLYWDTVERVVVIWMRSETFTHGILVPPIVAWLIWRRRHALTRLAPRPTWSFLPATALIVFAWLLGNLTATNAVIFLALVALLVLAVPAIVGFPVAKSLAFPLGYLFFAVPIGEFVMPQMMEWTADFTIQALVLTGIPVYREGLHFVIPSGSWSVVEACSGVRYLIASVVVGTLYAYLNYRSTKKRLIFVLVSLLVPIVANWLRAYMIVMLGHLSGNKLAVGVDHLVYGWIFFGVVILLMFMIGARWADHPDAAEYVGGSPAEVARPSSSGHIWGAAILFAILSALPHVWLIAIERAEVSRGGTPIQLNLTAPEGWQTAEPRTIAWRPVFANPTAELQAEFAQGERRVGVFVGYYRQQDYDRKLISSANALVRSSDQEWRRVQSGVRAATINGETRQIRTAELRGPGNKRLLVWQWFWINGRLTTSDHLAKAYQAFNRLIGQGDDSAVIILYAPQEGPEGGEATLERFASTHAQAIESALNGLR